MNYQRYVPPALQLLSTAVLFASCVKMQDVPGSVSPDDVIKMSVPPGFNYQTTTDVALDIKLLTNDNKPLKGVLVNILDKPLAEEGKVLYTALTGADGNIGGNIKLPAYLKKVYVDANYIGVLSNAAVRIEGNKVLATLGGDKGFGGNVEAAASSTEVVTAPAFSPRLQNTPSYVYLGNYTSMGKPLYLENPGDVIPSSLLANVNASLPEGKSVPSLHPEYLSANSEINLNITQLADVWITFVHEGAGYKNALAFFTYPTGQPPTSVSQISKLTFIFPNVSYTGSGGDLASGNKVKIGRFQPGTSVGFCLVADGWSDNSRAVGAGLNKFYSIDALNPETNASLKRHTVLLRDNTHGVFLIGFDDQRRDQNSDNDFNDAIFYATSNPVTAISTNNINLVATPNDSDGDGVNDQNDQFPTDPARAYINYYPSATGFTSVAFEDTWPNTGDYDLNDIVIDQRYRIINNAANNTVEIFGDYVLRASGGSYTNGYGIQFPFAPSIVSSVTGSRITANVVTLASNGCETGQSKAVIFPFDDFYGAINRTNTRYVNTDPAQATITPDTIKMKVSFTSPISAATLGAAPFNPFIVCNRNRGYEAHLPGYQPTDKVNTSLFNTSMDNTVPSLGKFYKTAANLPFGICIPEKFEYPIEGKSINTIYYKFVEWAQSGGVSVPDWYQNKTGYRSANYFFKP